MIKLLCLALSKLHKIILWGILILYSLSYSYSIALADDDLPRGSYSLSLGEQRPAVPFPALQNFNTELTQQGAGPGFTVAVSRHHIIPYNVLRAFYNTVVTSGHLIYLRGFLNAMGDNINGYVGAASMDCSSSSGTVNMALNMMSSMRLGLIRNSSPGDYPDGLDDFHSFYVWLPGNLFIGPHNRSDDPGDAFEENAAYIVGVNRYARLLRAYNFMRDYNSDHQLSHLQGAVRELSIIARERSVHPLVSAEWTRDEDGKYAINTKESRQTRSISVSKDANDMDDDTITSNETQKCNIQSKAIRKFNAAIYNSLLPLLLQ